MEVLESYQTRNPVFLVGKNRYVRMFTHRGCIYLGYVCMLCLFLPFHKTIVCFSLCSNCGKSDDDPLCITACLIAPCLILFDNAGMPQGLWTYVKRHQFFETNYLLRWQFNFWFIYPNTQCLVYLQGGPLQVINRVITPINGLING